MMTCTRCFRPAGGEPETSGLNAAAIIALCENWLCDDCLNEIDDAAINAGEHPPSRPREGCSLPCCETAP
jgi:hypothetical protein